MGTQELLTHIEAPAQENPVLDIMEDRDEYTGSHRTLHELEWLEASDPQNRSDHRQDHEGEPNRLHSEEAAGERWESLYDHVLFQLNAMALEPQLAFCAECLAGCLDRNGWLGEDLFLLADEFGQPFERIERALAVVQSLEPAGIGARSLSECLCLQLKRRVPVDQLALSIAAGYLESLTRIGTEWSPGHWTPVRMLCAGPPR